MTHQPRPDEFRPDNINVIWTRPDPVATAHFPGEEIQYSDNINILWTRPDPVDALRLAGEESYSPDYLKEAELVRSAEHLRYRVIGDAFTRLFRRLRTYHKTWAKPVASVRLPDELPEPIDAVEVVRSAEQLRAQVIGDAFAQFSRHRRMHRNQAAPQFVGAYSIASSGTGASS